jgi:hypothetical protein
MSSYEYDCRALNVNTYPYLKAPHLALCKKIMSINKPTNLGHLVRGEANVLLFGAWHFKSSFCAFVDCHFGFY